MPSYRRRTSWFCPLAIRFSQADISCRFSGDPYRGVSLDETIDLLCLGDIRPEDFEPLLVVVRPGQWPVAVNNRRLYVFRVAYARGACKACPCEVVPETSSRIIDRLDVAFSSANGGLRVQVSGNNSRYIHLQNGYILDVGAAMRDPDKDLVNLCARLAEKAGFPFESGAQFARTLATEGYFNVDSCYAIDEAIHSVLSEKGVPIRVLGDLRAELAQPCQRSHWTVDRQRARAPSPTAPIQELQEIDGKLRVVLKSGAVRWFRRDPAAELSAALWMPLAKQPQYDLVRNWLSGTPLFQLVQFRRGGAGRTPTIASGGLSEVDLDANGVTSLEVSFSDHGKFEYKRSDDQMPCERNPREPAWKPVVWLEKQSTYGSPGLGMPVPNRVAEWFEGRRLSPRQRRNA